MGIAPRLCIPLPRGQFLEIGVRLRADRWFLLCLGEWAHVGFLEGHGWWLSYFPTGRDFRADTLAQLLHRVRHHDYATR